MQVESRVRPRSFRLFFLMLAFFVLAIGCGVSSPNGCDEPTVPPPGDALLSIDIQYDFENDDISVELDNHVLFCESVTTNLSTSLARNERLTVSPGSHHLEVYVLNRGLLIDRSARDDTTVSIEDTLTVAVRYERLTNKISFRLYDHILYYR